MKASPLFHAAVFVLVALFFASLPAQSDNELATISLGDESNRPALQFAAEEIRTNCCGKVQAKLVVRPEPGLARDGESYSIIKQGPVWIVTGNGVRGTMYGGLEIAEHYKLYGNLKQLKTGKRKAFLDVRQYKFNLPLKGTGYLSEEAEAKNAWFYDLDFWRSFFEMCARNRYNEVSFWSANPWHHMVRVKKYPESQVLPDEELDRNIKHFHNIFKIGMDHGVDISLYTWNILTSPALAKAHDLKTRKHWGTNVLQKQQWDDLVMDYVRESVKEVLLEYPEIKIMGTCPGENMAMSEAKRAEWIAAVYLEGIKRSGRKVPFAIRYWGGEPDSISQLIAQKHSPTYLTIKFNGESMYSSVKPHFNKHNSGKSWSGDDKKYQLVWHLRNDDLYLLRWGDPDFARAMLKNCKKGNGAGYLVGSEIKVPGEDYVSSKEVMKNRNWKYEFERHWFRFMLWGKLGYNPELPDDMFKRHFKARFGSKVGSRFYKATTHASHIFPLVTRFHWNYMNGDWYVEGNVGGWNTGWGRGYNFRNSYSKFHDVLEFIFNHTIDDDYQNIPQYVTSQLMLNKVAGITPLEVASKLERDARFALKQLETGEMSVAGSRGEFLSTRDDLKMTAGMGLHYAEKIRGAVALCFYLATEDPAHQKKAVEHLSKALVQWKRVAEIAKANFIQHEIWLQGQFSWDMYTTNAEEDIDIARCLLPNRKAFVDNPFFKEQNCYKQDYNFSNIAPFGVIGNGMAGLRYSLEELKGIEPTNASALVFGRNSVSLNTLDDEYRQTILNKVEQGLYLILFNQDAPAFNYKWLPGRIELSDNDSNQAGVVSMHPLTTGIIAGDLLFPKVVNDGLSLSAAVGWRELIEPGVLAIYPHGKGAIICCQLPVIVEAERRVSKTVLANMKSYTKVSNKRPWICLDMGALGQIKRILKQSGIAVQTSAAPKEQ
jgi:hypothetical protein